MRLAYCRKCRKIHEAPSCSLRASLEKAYLPLLRKGVRVSVFSPYVEENLTGEPIEITSRAQRDALLAQHGCTYDRWSRPPKRPSALDDLSFDEVMKETKKALGETIG